MMARGTDWAKTVRILCAIALLCLGLAHKPPVIGAPAPGGLLAEYVLPDGTLSSACTPGHDEGEDHKSLDRGNGCEACRITQSISLALPADRCGQKVEVASDVQFPVRRNVLHARLVAPSALARGPPSVAIA
ncbi:hypothetical protein [Ensifer sp.]|uniref:hypothetical protein n=1 Tax=Ensifer sp. TaxID=1872086 RepID=UPI0028A1B394|nr:hypothetical protein [Ensifer sp.]